MAQEEEDKKLFAGRWTREEEEYCDELINEFRAGNLTGIEEGATLRNFLAESLGCHSKRISKKYEGSEYNGRQQFWRRIKPMTSEEAKERQDRLEQCKQKFIEAREYSVQRAKRKKRRFRSVAQPTGEQQKRTKTETQAPASRLATAAHDPQEAAAAARRPSQAESQSATSAYSSAVASKALASVAAAKAPPTSVRETDQKVTPTLQDLSGLLSPAQIGALSSSLLGPAPAPPPPAASGLDALLRLAHQPSLGQADPLQQLLNQLGLSAPAQATTPNLSWSQLQALQALQGQQTLDSLVSRTLLNANQPTPFLGSSATIEGLLGSAASHTGLPQQPTLQNLDLLMALANPAAAPLLARPPQASAPANQMRELMGLFESHQQSLRNAAVRQASSTVAASSQPTSDLMDMARTQAEQNQMLQAMLDLEPGQHADQKKKSLPRKDPPQNDDDGS